MRLAGRRLVLTAVLAAVPAVAAALVVAVSVPPQAALVERLAGPDVAVVVAVPPGESPHTFAPTPGQIAALAAADLYVATGVEIEIQLLPRLTALAPAMRVIGPRADLDRHAHDPTDHTHGHACGDDPHRWLDPRLAAETTAEIAASLAGLLPEQAADIRQRADTLAAELGALHDELAGILAPVAGRDLVVAHPAFGHFANAYGLNQVAVEHEGREPSPRQLAAVLARVRERGSSTLFVQPQFPLAAARSLARVADVELVTLDPLAADYPENLRQMAQAIVLALTPPDGS